MFDECIMDFGEPFKNTKSSLSANFSWYLTWCSDYFYHWFNEFNGFNGLCPAKCKTKTRKTPCVGCKMSLTSHWCCACLKILKQAWIFSVSYIITLQGLCIHRKAINKNKPQSSGVLPSRQSIERRSILAHLLRRCTRLLMVLPSRQQSACGVLMIDSSYPW